jgi:uncharacterized protein YndB with AHSA1/START domain
VTSEAVLIDRDGHPTLCFERRLSAPVDRAWRAVTDPDEMRSWFPAAVVGERRVGAPLSFPFDDNVADTFEGEVTAWDPTSVFAFTWYGDEIRIELTPDGDATRLRFTHELSNVSPAARTGAGWHACLANLDAHLGGPPADPDAWKTVYPRYLQTMGPALGEPDGDAMTWVRGHHAAAGEIEHALAHPDEWDGDLEGDVTYDVRTLEHGSAFTVRHPKAGADPELAARLHAQLVQLDMYLASKQIVPADPALFLDDYRALLA